MIDELGSRVDVEISLKILYATIKYLSQNNDDHFSQNFALTKPLNKFKIPICLVITHLTELMVEKVLEQGEIVRFLHTEMTKQDGVIFKVSPGIDLVRYGINCA